VTALRRFIFERRVRRRAVEIVEHHLAQANLDLCFTQRSVRGDDATAGLDQLLAGFHGTHQGILADAGGEMGFLAGHRHHGSQLRDGSNGGIDGGFSGEQLLSNFVRGETTFFQHSSILFHEEEELAADTRSQLGWTSFRTPKQLVPEGLK
jgi:hypothetical protein